MAAELETTGSLTEAQLHEHVQNMANELEILQESYADLMTSREDRGWLSILAAGEAELNRGHLENQAKLCRVFFTANPLIKRGLQLRAHYVFGQGVGTTAKGEKANEIVQNFLDDPTAREVLFGAQAQEQLENLLGTDGNVFICMVTEPITGAVTPRLVPFDEIREIVTAPGDAAKVHYYLREWTEYDPRTEKTEQRKAYYPQLRFDPLTKPRTLGRADPVPVFWNMPLYHIKVNNQVFQKWGIGDAYAALPWARAYKEFLEDWSVLMKSLSKIAYAHTRSAEAKGSQKARKQALSQMSEVSAGSSITMAPGDRLEAVPKTGATIDAESGRPLATMIAAALGFPVTTLLSDPGQTGARATAQTLELPTRLVMEARQQIWTEARRQLLEYVLLTAVKAPQSGFTGRIKRNAQGWTTPVVPNPEDLTLTITFPPLDETPIEDLVAAIVKADSTGKIPPLVIAEKLLRALRTKDVDEVLAKMQDEEGNFLDPYRETLTTVGNQAAAAFRAGTDPAEIV